MTTYDKSLKIIELINDESRNFKYSNNSSLAPYDQAKKVPKKFPISQRYSWNSRIRVVFNDADTKGKFWRRTFFVAKIDIRVSAL